MHRITDSILSQRDTSQNLLDSKSTGASLQRSVNHKTWMSHYMKLRPTQRIALNRAIQEFTARADELQSLIEKIDPQMQDFQLINLRRLIEETLEKSVQIRRGLRASASLRAEIPQDRES